MLEKFDHLGYCMISPPDQQVESSSTHPMVDLNRKPVGHSPRNKNCSAAEMMAQPMLLTRGFATFDYQLNYENHRQNMRKCAGNWQCLIENASLTPSPKKKK